MPIYGINLGTGNSSLVESCTAQQIGSIGLLASTITRSSANQCGGYGIDGTVVSECVGSGGSYGIYAANSATGCSGSSVTGTGISTSIAIGCYGFSSSGAGLSATLANSCYGNTETIVNKYNMP